MINLLINIKSDLKEHYAINRIKCSLVIALMLGGISLSGQQSESARVDQIRNQLEALAVDNDGLTEQLKLEINVSNVSLSNFLLAVSRVHELNITVAPEISELTIVNNFSDVTVADLLVFLCKEYTLDIDFTGNIFAVKKYLPPTPIPEEKEILVQYNPQSDLLSLDLNNDPLADTFRKIIDLSGRNLLYSQGLEQTSLTLYLNNASFDAAMEQLAALHGMQVRQSQEGFYLFNKLDSNQVRQPFRGGRSYSVIDTIQRSLAVDFQKTPIAQIVENLAADLDLDVYTATPLESAGTVTFKANFIFLDELLDYIFEQRAGTVEITPIDNNPRDRRNNRQEVTEIQNTPLEFTYKKEGDIYFFGTKDQLSVREVAVIPMMYRSIEMLSDPVSFAGRSRTAGRTNPGQINFLNSGLGNNQNTGILNSDPRNQNQRGVNSTQNNTFPEALSQLLPEELTQDLEIRPDFELNSFLVSGPAAKVKRFRQFIQEIDKPVPVVLIEVMILEVNRSSTVETGISWGLGDEPTVTRGQLYPQTDLTLGAKTVNKIIGGFDGFGSFNIGQVVPEFFATIKAMEANGNIKIRSTPKLSTLNGHRAHLSIGETTYYVITNQSFFGSQIPTSSEIRNYAPIDAELGVSIKPLVSGNGQVTLDINVIQSDFSSERIEEDAPPGLTSREFSSIIRMQNQDLAILGGLEEKVKNDSGNGVPFLARVPVIKWLFSQRRREDTKQKLTILIKPTVIY